MEADRPTGTAIKLVKEPPLEAKPKDLAILVRIITLVLGWAAVLWGHFGLMRPPFPDPVGIVAGLAWG